MLLSSVTIFGMNLVNKLTHCTEFHISFPMIKLTNSMFFKNMNYKCGFILQSTFSDP